MLPVFLDGRDHDTDKDVLVLLTGLSRLRLRARLKSSTKLRDGLVVRQVRTRRMRRLFESSNVVDSRAGRPLEDVLFCQGPHLLDDHAVDRLLDQRPRWLRLRQAFQRRLSVLW